MNASAAGSAANAAATAARPPKVAVIGAGAAGMAAARVLSRNGIIPTVLEKEGKVGGVWNYVKNANDRPMYRGLRTNLPKEIMGYREFPWTNEFVDDGQRSYVTHRDVANYLEAYRNEFNLSRYIKHGCCIDHLKVLDNEPSLLSPPNEAWSRIRLSWRQSRDIIGDGRCENRQAELRSDTFDAVLICNGHYARPSNPTVPGVENFDGIIMHSIQYDDPSAFKDETVLCIGGRASGSDLAREISHHAKHVYLSDSTCHSLVNGQPQQLGNVTWVPRTIEIQRDGSARFGDGCSVKPKVDRIILCSGYDYAFPFINDASNLNLQCTPGERRVKPLYKQLWHAQHPNLAFVGLPHSVLPFPLFEFQAEAACATWLQAAQDLPQLDARMQAAEDDANGGGPKAAGRVQDTHYLGSAQWDYCRDLSRISNLYDADMEAYIATNKAIYDHSGESRKSLFPGGPDGYRSLLYTRNFVDQSFSVKEEVLEVWP